MKTKTIALPIAILVLALSTTGAYATETMNNNGLIRANIGIDASVDANTRDKSYEKKTDENKKMFSYDPGVLGTVTAKSATSITLKSTNNGTVYIVDSTDAKVKNSDKKDVSLSDISVGDTILVQGTINKTTIDAKHIFVAKLPKGLVLKNTMSGIAGSVTAINGSTLTVKGKKDITYTIDAGDARIRYEKDTDATIGDISVGDVVVVQGIVEGTAINANIVFAYDQDSAQEMKKEIKADVKAGFFHRIGLFFKGMFGKK